MSTRLFANLIDDAAMFPPGDASMSDALRDHLVHRSSAYASLAGPLLVRDADVAALAELAEEPLDVAIIASTPSAIKPALDAAGQLRVVGVEIAIPQTDSHETAAQSLVRALADAMPPGVTISVELPRLDSRHSTDWLRAADVVHAAGFQSKFRTGGLTHEAHPSEAELALALAALVHGGHRFKLTAGLHRAIRNIDPVNGFEQHGFVNVLVAVHHLLGGGDSAYAARILADGDRETLAAIVRGWSDPEVDAVRDRFRSFGSCSVLEPHADLVALGLFA